MPKSIIIKKNGGPEVLELQDVNVGSPGPDEIKVTNHAIGLNFIDTYNRSGLYPLKLPSGIGYEAAGKIDEVGSKVTEFNKGDNIIILDGQGKTYRGLEGDDTYFVSQLLPKSGKVSITDTEGSNTIQLPVNTYVDKSLFTKNAARLTLEDGREITISGADKFSYNVGGNITDGIKGTDLTFTEFAEVFGVYDILNSSGAQTGEISDMYII